MKRNLIIISLILLTLSCQHSDRVEQRIVEKANGCKSNTTCFIKINELTDFEWDQMHAFSLGASQEFIEKSLGIPFPNYVEFKRRLVFMKAGKIVHREDEPTDVSHPVDGEVSFAESYPEPSHWLFTPETAVFKAEMRRFENASTYLLRQVKQ